MHDVLIYAVDEQSIREIRELVSEDICSITIVGNPEEALEACRQDLFDLAFIWRAGFEESAEFLTIITRNKFGYIPIVAVLPDSDELTNFLALPLVDYVTLPASKTDFFRLITQVLQDTDVQSTVVEGMNWQGSVEEYGLIDLVQMIEGSHRDVELILSYGQRSGQVVFIEGEVVAAEYQDLRGFQALLKLAFWPRGSFQTRLINAENVDRNISDGNQEILFALVEKLMKLENLFADLPELATQLIRNPMVSPESLTALQHRICKHCEASQTIVDLLLQMPDENEDILGELQRLLSNGLIGEKTYIEELLREEKERSSISKLFGSFSSIFKRAPSYDGSGEAMGEENFIEPHLELKPLPLKRIELEKISKTVEGLIRK
ncbi:MAG: DUF4388 domain-containing protein [Calditrichia bacterium]